MNQGYRAAVLSSLKLLKQTGVSATIFFSIAKQKLLYLSHAESSNKINWWTSFPAGNCQQSKSQKPHLGYRELMEGLLGFYGTAYHGFWCNRGQCSTHRLPVSKDFWSCFISLKISGVWCKQYVIITLKWSINWFFNGCWTLKARLV